MFRRSRVVVLLAAFAGVAAGGQRTLYEAARDGDAATVERRLAEGADVREAPNGRDDCPLAAAAGQGHTAVVEALLAAGSAVDCGPPAYPPLVAAARGGHLATVDLLLARGAGRDGAATRALLAAAAEGHPRTAARLVAAGAELEGRDLDGLTPLAVAARAGRLATARALLDLGASPAAADGAGRTALHWGSWRRHPDVVRLLLARGAVDAPDAHGDRALLDAPDVEHALAAMSAARAAASGRGECAVLPLFASGGARRAGEITAWNAPLRPAVGERAWVIAEESSAAQRAAVVGVGADACTGEQFEPQLALAGGETAVDGRRFAVLIGATEAPRRLGAVTRGELPWGLFPETVAAALDLDADGRADVLLRDLCCGDDWLPGPRDGEAFRCEYTCSETWWRGPAGWRLCSEGGPC